MRGEKSYKNATRVVFQTFSPRIEEFVARRRVLRSRCANTYSNSHDFVVSGACLCVLYPCGEHMCDTNFDSLKEQSN